MTDVIVLHVTEDIPDHDQVERMRKEMLEQVGPFGIDVLVVYGDGVKSVNVAHGTKDARTFLTKDGMDG
jgi:hypothetical protein